MDVYKNCPTLESDKYLIRFLEERDLDDLFEIYSDKNALPFFNSDNCDGDNFYYPTKERMAEAVKFWLDAYKNGWFVRFTVVDKSTQKAVGTIEMFRRAGATDTFNNCGVLRLDVRSDCERADVLYGIISVIVPPSFELFGCDEIITKAPNYAVERIAAVEKFGFRRSENLMVGTNDGYAYNGYWIIGR
ncbi:MAG: GNAT family N-acetyltransferase [Ruminococcaceae bacterium]|nr:GNAT family N-acetyltransferase [Oscillospiraceae bacterium]